jgi:hypothetical protein
MTSSSPSRTRGNFPIARIKFKKKSCVHPSDDVSSTGLPDGLFSNQPSVSVHLGSLLISFMTSWFTLWSFAFLVVCGNSLYYPNFGKLKQEKSGNPGQQNKSSR